MPHPPNMVAWVVETLALASGNPTAALLGGPVTKAEAVKLCADHATGNQLGFPNTHLAYFIQEWAYGSEFDGFATYTIKNSPLIPVNIVEARFGRRRRGGAYEGMA